MLTPEQAAPTRQTRPDNAEEQKALEAHIDVQLAFGLRRLFPPTGAWSRDSIKAVLDRYRAAGWTIDEDGVEWTFSA